jgi:hypothetical protein
MLTFTTFKLRFPEFSDIDESRFNLFQEDAVLIMGANELRWLAYYDVAQANLISHFLIINEAQSLGDSNSSGPIKRTDVDDVQVEYATSSAGASVGVDADLNSTSYGQAYCRWRRMAFAGPRVV